VVSNVDDAVRLSPEDLRVVLPVRHSSTACAGAVAGFLLRRIAYRAGAYAPGIQEFLWHELNSSAYGRSVDTVGTWMVTHARDLHDLGYRLLGRRVMGERTDAILGWVREGKGYRGAILATEYKRLHPAETDAGELEHAVGVTIDRVDAKSAEDLVMIDPWPGTKNGARERGAVPPALEAAHRKNKYAALIIYWAGWS
jgi:hypothetical protein